MILKPYRSFFLSFALVLLPLLGWAQASQTNPAGKFIIPTDTSQLDLAKMALKISEGTHSTYDKVNAVITWANSNLSWTATDYVKRTPKEVICRRGGNCNEEAMVVRALLARIGVQTRRTREINIQPEDSGRQKRAAALVEKNGFQYSVFGLRHNDHVWIEFYDEQAQEWRPADPTLGLVGLDQWLKARVGFEARPVHHILPSRDMLVPIYIMAVDEKTNKPGENRTEHYLIQSFNKVYGGRLERAAAWQLWVELVRLINPHCEAAFQGKENLHQYNDAIAKIAGIYEDLKKQSH